MEIKTTQRGFKRAEFLDQYGKVCSIQESSLAEPPCIWLGVHEDRMHLTQEQAAHLIPLLQYFVETGNLPESWLDTCS